jgi:hypothetical protein
VTTLLHDRKFDPATIAGIAREVVRRLREIERGETGGPKESPNQTQKPTDNLNPIIAEKLITIATLDRHAGATEIVASTRAVVTPAAREEAARRGIAIVSDSAPPSPVTVSTLPISGSASDVQASGAPITFGDAFDQQLIRRGIVMPAGVTLVWTDRPADEVYRRCSSGQRAAMLTALTDVQRFADELSPTVWVLDAERLNLSAAVNVASRIAKVACPSTGDNR